MMYQIRNAMNPAAPKPARKKTWDMVSLGKSAISAFNGQNGFLSLFCRFWSRSDTLNYLNILRRYSIKIVNECVNLPIDGSGFVLIKLFHRIALFFRPIAH